MCGEELLEEGPLVSDCPMKWNENDIQSVCMLNFDVRGEETGGKMSGGELSRLDGPMPRLELSSCASIIIL
jgi:hypothetical protein